MGGVGLMSHHGYGWLKERGTDEILLVRDPMGRTIAKFPYHALRRRVGLAISTCIMRINTGTTVERERMLEQLREISTLRRTP